MAKRSPAPAPEGARYDLFDRLDRLEELLEDMIALEITSRDELEERIDELNSQIDAIEAGERP